VVANPTKIKKQNQNDYKRFIKRINASEGEIKEKESYTLDDELIKSEAMYDGFYTVCTNLDEDAAKIAKINRQRWQIEECFRIMKKPEPHYLQWVSGFLFSKTVKDGILNGRQIHLPLIILTKIMIIAITRRI